MPATSVFFGVVIRMFSNDHGPPHFPAKPRGQRGTLALQAGCSIRPGTAADLSFLRQMLVHAAYWRPGDAPADVESALQRSDLVPLLAHWGRAGDTAFIAEGEAGQLGAAWYRFWTPEAHSYGFVDASTPELAIGVSPAARYQGIGTGLLTTLIDCARAQAVEQLSLSVEPENPALRLYQRLGFRTHAQVGGAWTMVLRLAAY